MPARRSTVSRVTAIAWPMSSAAIEYPTQAELARILESGIPWAEEHRVLEILDDMDVRRRLVWAALQERDLARAAVAELPCRDGAALLDIFFDWTFRDVARMLTRRPTLAG
jgi:hypothetical protein